MTLPNPPGGIPDRHAAPCRRPAAVTGETAGAKLRDPTPVSGNPTVRSYRDAPQAWRRDQCRKNTWLPMTTVTGWRRTHRSLVFSGLKKPLAPREGSAP